MDNDSLRKLFPVYPDKVIAILQERYRIGLLHLSMKYTHDEQASEDIVQEAFNELWNRRTALAKHHEISIRQYLVKIVRNKAVDHLRAAERMEKYREQYLNGNPFHGKDHSHEYHIINMEKVQEIRRMIATFPRRERECLLLKIDEALSPPDIALRLGVSLKAVQARLTSANKRLRERLKHRE